MITIDAMMVCLDLSELDDKLIAFSRSVCERLQVRKVYFVHNIKLYELADEFREMLGDLDLSQEVEGNIADLVAEQFGNITDHEILVSQEPNTEVILANLVRRYNIKLTLLGKTMSDKRTGAQGTKLLRILPCSVLVCPETASFNLRKVLVPIDFSDTSLHALRLSKALTDQLGLELEILHVYRLPTQFFPLISEEEAIRKAVEVVKGKFADLQRRHPEIAGVPYTLVRAANKTIAERIALHQEKGHHDLLVLGLRSMNALPALSLGSVAADVYNSDVGVPLWLVYPEEPARK
ncbi:universal stress protein [Pontibacter indicus]|uniref:Nucleotide-binding universal stress protein, UspA family n=1 Tax=Pontibacter indicus TaxID=1317125 RepID=A0A1R3XPG1_9BACT|nr:universal stress protein [Pontibacter indicus]SIT93535.1 Nucleotide-binding universal stress protein, UspA family [Pontibacter indicus]